MQPCSIRATRCVALLAALAASCGLFAHAAPASAGISLPRAAARDGRDGGRTLTFTTLDNHADPTFNQLLGINDAGVISGYYGIGGSAHPFVGYTLAAPYGQANYTIENFPGAAQTQVTAINNHNDTSGFWVDANNNNFGFVAWNGVFTSYKDRRSHGGTVS